MWWRRLVIVLVILQAGTAVARAADISAVPSKKNPREAIIFVEGDFVAADIDQFRAKIAPFSGGVVVLGSDGGSVYAGVEIGRMIRLRNFTTWVPSGIRCSSACAAAWLGGTRRMMGKTALVGFHAAYKMDQGKLSESAVGNALLGGYLSQIGLSDRAIIYITQTSPSSMTWLTLADAERVGIDVGLYDLDEKPEPKTPPDTPASLQTRAARFLDQLYRTTSGPAEGAAAALASFYGPYVSYYGKALTRDQVLSQVAAFVSRWPVRRYEPEWTTVDIQCFDEGTCIAKGRLRFDARSIERNEQSLGSATFEYTLMYPPRAELPLIVAENGSVLERRKHALAPQDATALSPLGALPPVPSSSVGQRPDLHAPR